jgi:hypothetical protein
VYENGSASATGFGSKSDEKIYIYETVLSGISIKKRGQNAQVYLMGGKNNIVKTVAPLENNGGCEDTPHTNASNVANAMNYFISQGMDSIGFLFSRGQIRMYNHYDSLVNNLLIWKELFGNCYTVLITPKRNYAWKIADGKLMKTQIEIKKGGD